MDAIDREGPAYQFPVVMRGYDRDMVDAALGGLQRRVAETSGERQTDATQIETLTAGLDAAGNRLRVLEAELENAWQRCEVAEAATTGDASRVLDRERLEAELAEAREEARSGHVVLRVAQHELATTRDDLAAVAADLETTRYEARRAAEEAEVLCERVRALEAAPVGAPPATFGQFGQNIAEILRVAEEQADTIRDAAGHETAELRAAAAAEVEELRRATAEEATALRASAEADADVVRRRADEAAAAQAARTANDAREAATAASATADAAEALRREAAEDRERARGELDEAHRSAAAKVGDAETAAEAARARAEGAAEALLARAHVDAMGLVEIARLEAEEHHNATRARLDAYRVDVDAKVAELVSERLRIIDEIGWLASSLDRILGETSEADDAGWPLSALVAVPDRRSLSSPQPVGGNGRGRRPGLA